MEDADFWRAYQAHGHTGLEPLWREDTPYGVRVHAGLPFYYGGAARRLDGGGSPLVASCVSLARTGRWTRLGHWTNTPPWTLGPRPFNFKTSGDRTPQRMSQSVFVFDFSGVGAGTDLRLRLTSGFGESGTHIPNARSHGVLPQNLRPCSLATSRAMRTKMSCYIWGVT